MKRLGRGPGRAGIALALLIPAGLLRADLYVANFNGPSITVYATSAAGNTAPVRTIAGSNTGIAGPESVTVVAIAQNIPALSGWGLLVLGALLAGLGYFLSRPGSPAA